MAPQLQDTSSLDPKQTMALREATEITLLPVAATTPIEDTSTREGEIWASSEEDVASANGCQAVYWSRWVENQNMVQLIINWDSIEHHTRYTQTPNFGPYLERLSSVLNGPMVMYHVHFTPHPPTNALAAPVTELCTVYFPAAITPTEKDRWYHGFTHFLSQLIQNAEGMVAEAHGWAVEEVAYGGQQCVAFVGAIGWESLEKNKTYGESQGCKDTIGALADGSLGMEMHHVVFADP